MNDRNDEVIKNLRDYNTPNGYVYAGIDAGRSLRPLVVALIKLPFRLILVLFNLIRG
ncbi:hypothetical protein R69608_05099 [Paraburkholderia nemoris]|uniref:hypothetical protein n=1 Tax=Paraburkholderia nemoris TaxID=2793076 RepID=UPI0019147C56|nr:hypothetical protein [Paraburkholderia nemoris]MBK5149696.1 hypothetical protein [Burkholderia sp. R-69608]CAE6938565.1 hypothetical protein R69608_05099 [Paraburkholderia nemoris]